MARRKKTDPNAPGGNIEPTPGVGHNGKPKLNDDEMRALFTTHRTSWNEWKAKLAVVEKIERDVKASLKSDGFTVKQMQIADEMITVKGEAKVTNEIEDRLKVAMWIGHPLGRQLEMFQQPDRTPAVDRAYEDGKTAGLEGRTRKPPYSPEVPQHEEWMNGWYAGQELMMKKGGDFKGTDAAAGS